MGLAPSKFLDIIGCCAVLLNLTKDLSDKGSWEAIYVTRLARSLGG